VYASRTKLYTPGTVPQNDYEIRITDIKLVVPGIVTEKYYVLG
jgi:hypothetical protein